jgi:hypothetical protein
LEVIDTGIGIKPEALSHLFDEFTQADQATTREYGGTGLGLAITKELTHLMHCKVDVISEYCKGTSFVITGEFLHALSQESLPSILIKGTTILYFDESPTNAEVFDRTLKHMGTCPTVVLNPDEVVGTLLLAQKKECLSRLQLSINQCR